MRPAVGGGAAGDWVEVDAVPVGVQFPVAGLERGVGRGDRERTVVGAHARM